MATSNSVSLTPVVSSPFNPATHGEVRSDIYSAALSGNGNVLVFTSSQALLAEDTNGFADVYIKDLASNTLRLAPLNPNQLLANSGGHELSLSADGRYLALLTGGPTGGIFVRDLQTGTAVLASSNANGVAANAVSTSPKISADGQFVTFVSKATNLTTLDTLGKKQVYVKNLQTGALTLASSDANGNPANMDAIGPSISADGRIVQFGSGSTNLGSGGEYGNRKAFVKDLQTGAIVMTSTDPNGRMTQIDGGQISANGRYSMFDSYWDLIPGDVNGRRDVYVKDLQTGQLTLATPGGFLNKPYGTATADAISGDGRYVLFHAYVADLIGNDDSPLKVSGYSPPDSQYYLSDLHTGTLTRISSDALGHKANAAGTLAALAGDGLSAIFLTTASNLGGPADKETLYRATLGPQVQHPHDHLEDSAVAPQVLAGGLGDDSYLVRHAATRITEMPGEGRDRVVSLVDHFVLPAHIEELQLRGKLAAHGVGNDMANIIRGNELDNLLEGKGGDDHFYVSLGSDTFDGGDGFDTIFYPGDRDELIITRANDGSFVMSYRDESITVRDTWRNMERVHMIDMSLAFDIDGAAGQAYRIYQAAFNRVPDQTGLGYWINVMDRGASLNEVARGFVSSTEFATLYGSNPTNADIVNRLYANVLHRAPDASGAAFWTDVLNNQRATVADVLAQFSESPENQAALVGVTQNGIGYIPFV